MGAGGSKQVNLVNPARVHIPESFDIFYKKSLSIKLYLGLEKDQPLYAAGMPMGWYGDVILYNGPDDKSGELARVKDSGRLGGDCTMIMPPLNQGNEPVMEEMRVNGSLRHDHYDFPCVVGNGDKSHPEKFEWHRADKSEILQLGNKKKFTTEGWKLIRPAKNNEIVALCSSDYVIGWKTTGSFKYMGSGATGELGDLWSLMAALSFLRLWQRYMRNIMTGSIAVGAAA